MELVQLIFGALGEIATQVITWLTDMFTGVAGVFYTPGVAGATGELTLLGVLSLIGVGVGAFFFIFRWLSNLIRIRVGR